MNSYHEWKKSKSKKLDELQVGDNVPQQGNNTNYRMVGRAFGDATQAANPRFVSYLKPRVDALWRLRMHKAEKDNPGSTADPGQIRSLQDAFIRDMMVAITNMVRGSDAGAGRMVNFNKANLNTGYRPSPNQ